MRITNIPLAFAATIALLSSPLESRAALKQWVGTSGNWTTGANWSPAGMPQDFDSVYMRTFDATNRVVTYDVNDGFLHIHADVRVQSPGAGGVEFRTGGHHLELSTLTVSGSSTGSALYDIHSGSTFVNTATLGFNGLLHLNAGSLFQVTNFTHHSGFVGASPGSLLEVNGTYTFNDGAVQGAVRSNGTIVFHSQYLSDFDGELDNRGTLVFNSDVTFSHDILNRVSNTLPLGKRMNIERDFVHAGGTFTQFGDIDGDGYPSHLRVRGGATWNHQSPEFHDSNVRTISVGSGQEFEPLPGAGTYLFSGDGQLSVNTINLGLQSDGTFVQSGGYVSCGALNLSAGNGVNTRRGHYQFTSGSLGAALITIGGADTAGGSFVQTGGVAILGTVVMNVDSTSNAALSLSGGSLRFASLLNNGTYAQSGGIASTTGKIDGGGAISVTGTGSLTAARIRQNAVNIGGDGRIKIITPATPLVSPTNRVQLLTIEQAGNSVRGTWDLGPQTLVIDYAGPTPAANVRRYVASGYAGGSWNGTGLASSAAAADAGRKTALGYAEGSELFGAAGAVYDGVFADSSSIVVALTLYGDANLDGTVNLSDFNRLAANFGQSNASWFGGDFNYDGAVNLQDFNRFAGNFGRSASGPGVTPQDWSNLAAAVPEPTAAFALGGVAASAALSGRRRPRRPARR